VAVKSLEERVQQHLAQIQQRPPSVSSITKFRIGMACGVYRKPFLVNVELHRGVAYFLDSVKAEAGMGCGDTDIVRLGEFETNTSRWQGCAHCGTRYNEVDGSGYWWSTWCKCAPMLHCMGSTAECILGYLHGGARVAAQSQLAGVLAGRHVNSSHASRASDTIGRPANTIPSSWSLTNRQEVTGHFKLQVYGPQRSLRRMIWVDAYQRGPEGAPLRAQGLQL
jgi:hypothetical protein